MAKTGDLFKLIYLRTPRCCWYLVAIKAHMVRSGWYASSSNAFLYLYLTFNWHSFKQVSMFTVTGLEITWAVDCLPWKWLIIRPGCMMATDSSRTNFPQTSSNWWLHLVNFTLENEVKRRWNQKEFRWTSSSSSSMSNLIQIFSSSFVFCLIVHSCFITNAFQVGHG